MNQVSVCTLRYIYKENADKFNAFFKIQKIEI